jgi:ribosomal protein S18 acetylase RimI-like enzyme
MIFPMSKRQMRLVRSTLAKSAGDSATGFAQAPYATVAENESGVIGYQISTGGGQRAHLARLAVQPAVQGRGAGRALLSDLFRYITYAGISRLSVNTQSDNQVSLSLYQRMGFIRTGELYPVYTFDVVA